MNNTPPITSQFEVEVYKGLVCPGFVNTHCHLELSHMKNLMPEGTGLPEFVSQIPKKRKESKSPRFLAIKDADQNMREEGIVAVGDVSNTVDSLKVKEDSAIRYHSFIELFGLDKNKASELLSEGLKVLESFQASALSASLAPHAAYSLSPQLLKDIYTASKGQILSIHHQETPSENELFLDSKGELYNLFLSKGLDLSSQLEHKQSSAQYALMSYLPKEQKLLLVHNTCSGKDDIEQIEASFNRAYWCTCPKANWFIERRLPNYNLWRENKLKITIGTDSLASNNTLSVLEEIKLIQKKFPHIPTAELLCWASKNGAEFFGYNDLGSFKTGSKPGVVLIEQVDDLKLNPNSKVTVLA